MHHRVIDLIQKSPEERSPLEIELVLPWLKKKSELLQALKQDILLDIVRHCDYMNAEKDYVVIKQGDRGDCLYIILKGSVSVYIDPKFSGDDDIASEASKTPSPTRRRRSSVGKTPRQGSGAWHSMDRTPFGKFIIKFDAGKCFGEIALISEDAIRNASIITDEDTDFLVVHRELYNHTIKSYQEKEFQERRSFARSSPLFSTWTRQSQRLLEMSLIRERYSFNQLLIKQGEPWRGLIFIRKGRARVTVQPDRHPSQYPNMCPFMTEQDMLDIELSKDNKMKKRKPEGRKPVRQLQVHVRRRRGYAAAEQHARMRTVTLCDVGEGDIIGDVEAVMQMSTYLYSVECTAATEVYVLTTKNYERLLPKKNPKTLYLLRCMAEKKLCNRLERLQDDQVPLLRHLLCKLKLEARASLRPPTPPDCEDGEGHTLPERELMFKQLLSMFVQNRAELIEPRVPGSMYYLEMMREKARIRNSIREHNQEQRKRKPVWYTRTCRVARTSKQLREALEEQYLLEIGCFSPVTMRSIQEAKERKEEEELQLELKRRPDRTSFSSIHPDYPTDLVRLPPITNPSTSVNVTDVEVKQTDSMAEQKPEDSPNIRKEHTPEDEPHVPKMFLTLPPLGGSGIRPASKSPQPVLERTKTFITEIDNDETRSNPEVATLEKQRTMVEGDGREVRSATPPVERQEDNSSRDAISKASSRQLRRDMIRERYKNALLKNKLAARSDCTSYRDWETSDKSLKYLESRIRQFHVHNGEKRPVGRIKLPKLKRFEAKEDLGQPLIGGNVLVQRRTCSLARSKYRLVNHEHMRYHMVPAIPEYEQLKKTKMLLHLVMDEARAKFVKSYER